MGAASSSNAVKAVSAVTDSVSNSTTANAQQISNIQKKVDFNSCLVQLTGDFTVTEASTVSTTNKQIANAKSSTSLQNEISQSVLQEATSKVGSMGVGYAKASNSASVFANSSSSIKNDVMTSANQFNSDDQSFICNNSTIIAKNLDINLSSDGKFLSEQTLGQDNTTDIVNNISQSVSQKASATVQGLAGFLIALAVLIGVVGYTFAKPLDTAGGKIAISGLIFIVLGGIGSWMYMGKTPPFFNDPPDCSPQSSIGGCDSECGELSTKTLNIQEPPLRYVYPILAGGVGSINGNLLQISIAAVAQIVTSGTTSGSGNNAGYRIDVLEKFTKLLNEPLLTDLAKTVGVDMPPNPLINPAPAGTFLSIPIQYQTGIGQNAKDAESSKCTPLSLQVQDGAPGSPSDCPELIDASKLSPGTGSSNIQIANLNTEAWTTYVNESDKNAKFARFVLLSIINPTLDLSMYIQPDEIVSIKVDGTKQYAIASSVLDSCYKYEPDNAPQNFNDSISGSGKLTGKYGICLNTTYKFQTFMKKIGMWILLGVVGFGVLLIFINSRKSNNDSKNNSSESSSK